MHPGLFRFLYQNDVGFKHSQQLTSHYSRAPNKHHRVLDSLVGIISQKLTGRLLHQKCFEHVVRGRSELTSKWRKRWIRVTLSLSEQYPRRRRWKRYQRSWMFRPILLSSNHLHVQVSRTYPETAGLVFCWTHTFVGGLKFEEELQLLKDSMIDSMMKELRHNETRNMAESEKLLKAVQAIEVGKWSWDR